jgi:hypothetical protein
MIDNLVKSSDLEEKINKLKCFVDKFNENYDDHKIKERFLNLSSSDRAETSDGVQNPIAALELLMEVIVMYQEQSLASSLDFPLLQDSPNKDKSETQDEKAVLIKILSLAVILFHEKFFAQYWLHLLLSVSQPNTKSLPNQNVFLDRMKYLYYCQKKLSNFYYSSYSSSSSTSSTSFDLSTSPMISYQIFFFHITNSYLIAIKDFLNQRNQESNQLPKEICLFFDFFDSSLVRKFISFLLFHESDEEASVKEDAVVSQVKELKEGEEDQAISLSHLDNEKKQIFLTKNELLFVWKHLANSINNYKLILQFMEILFQQNEKKSNFELFNVNDTGDESIGLSLILSLFSQFLTIISSSSSSSMEDNSKNNNQQEYEYLHLLIQKIILKYSFSSLLISHLFSPSSSSLIFSKSYRKFIFVAILDIWGNTFFHNNGNLPLFESYSRLLLYLMKDWKQEDLHMEIKPIYLTIQHSSHDKNGDPLMIESLLINAISNGLECSVPLIRIHTMKVAVKYAAIMNYPLEFDELKEYEAMENKNLSTSSTSLLEEKAAEKERNEETAANNTKPDIPTLRADDEDDSDDEEEIQGYLLSKENDCIIGDIADNKRKVYYLRNCIESKCILLFGANLIFLVSFQC